MLKTKRAYDKKEDSDGRRILIDRLWPRGIKKSDAGIDDWLKELGPSTKLRKWFAHDPDKWNEFKNRYTDELCDPDKEKLLQHIAHSAITGTVTLLYGAKDSEHSNMEVLKELIMERMKNINRKKTDTI